MTIVDLVNNFKLLYDLGGLALPGLEDDEIKSLLNIEQYKLINQKFGGNNVYGQKFPDTPKRIDDLQGLLEKEVTLNASISFSQSSIIFILPSDFLHLYEIKLSYPNGTYEIAEQIEKDKQIRFAKSVRNVEPYIKTPKYSFIESASGQRKLRVFYDYKKNAEADIYSIDCIYIKKPTTLTSVADVTSLIDYNDDVYYELVRSTVDSAMSIVSPNKSQISQQQLNKTE